LNYIDFAAISLRLISYLGLIADLNGRAQYQLYIHVKVH